MAPVIGNAAPDFKSIAVQEGHFHEISLSNFSGKFLVLFFYPADFSRVCPTEVLQFSQQLNDFKQLDCEIVGVSCDSQYTHLAWTTTSLNDGGIGPIPFPLLSDKSGRISRDYGVYNEDTGAPSRALFIIDDQQIIRQITVSDRPVARSVDEVLRIVNSLKSDVDPEKGEIQDVKRGVKRPNKCEDGNILRKTSKMSSADERMDATTL